MLIWNMCLYECAERGRVADAVLDVRCDYKSRGLLAGCAGLHAEAGHTQPRRVSSGESGTWSDPCLCS